MKKIKWGALIIALLIPLAIGTASGVVSRAGEMYGAMIKPEGSPPAWLFPVVWTVLFALMGISSFLIYNSDASEKSKMSALTVYAVQLAVNLADILLQNGRVSFFVYLAHTALGARADNDIEILQNQSYSGIFAASIYIMAYFCRIFKPFGISSQQVNYEN